MLPIESSWKDILILVDSMRQNMKNVELGSSSLEARLKSLESSFRDEGIEIIKNHIKKTNEQYSSAVPEFDLVLRKMTEYAILLKQAEDKIREQ